jgi:hypothetical protein
MINEHTCQEWYWTKRVKWYFKICHAENIIKIIALPKIFNDQKDKGDTQEKKTHVCNPSYWGRGKVNLKIHSSKLL